MRPLFIWTLIQSALLAGCGAPRQSDAGPVITSYFEPAAPLVDYSVPPPLPKLTKPSRRGSIATIIDAEGDRVPESFQVEEMIAGVLHASWRDSPEALTARILAWQIIEDDRPLLVEQAILWLHFHAQGERESFQLVSIYRHPRETTPHLMGWKRAHRSVHSEKSSGATYEERPDHATVVRFFNDSGWDEVLFGFTLIDAAINAGAWKRATGQAPGFAYP